MIDNPNYVGPLPNYKIHSIIIMNGAIRIICTYNGAGCCEWITF